MKENKKQFNIKTACRLLNVSRSSYYADQSRVESSRTKSNRKLLVLIKTAHQKSLETYGAIRIHRELSEQGESYGKHRIARIMRQHGIKSVHRKKYRVQTTQSKHKLPVCDNVIRQDFTAKGMNEKWGGDISYIPTQEGHLYLAVMLDFYSRKVVGYSMGSSLETQLCSEALRRACAFRSPAPNLVHHSDRGVQYASNAYREVIKRHGFKQSMSRKGNCYDNAMVESFFHTLKVELVHRKKYSTRLEAKQDIEKYILEFYNSRRRHSSLDYVSPNQYEENNKVAS